jgi:hypothetical protein
MLQGLFPLERFAARKVENRAVITSMDIVAARSIGIKPSSMYIACENYHRGGFRSDKTPEWKQAFRDQQSYLLPTLTKKSRK